MDYITAKKFHKENNYEKFNEDPTFLFVNQFVKGGPSSDKELKQKFLDHIKFNPISKKVDEKCREVYEYVKNNNLLDSIIEFIQHNKDKAIWYKDEKEIQNQLEELNSLTLSSEEFNSKDSIDKAIFNKIKKVKQVKELDVVISDIKAKSMSKVYRMYFNTQTTRLIEDIFNSHKKVTPTLIDEKGVDFFIDKVPLDLKITHIPKGLDKETPKEDIIKNLYEKQGAIRFGAENRLFLILNDTKNPELSDKMRITHYNEIKKCISDYLDNFDNSYLKETSFTFDKKVYTVKSDLILVSI